MLYASYLALQDKIKNKTMLRKHLDMQLDFIMVARDIQCIAACYGSKI